jgi:hypothetical protein
MASFSVRTNSLAGSLKKWCRKKKPLQQELQDIEGQINQIQLKPLHEQDHTLETSLTTRYEHNLAKLNLFYKQRVKKNWAKDGDRNTCFFHQAILKRRKGIQLSPSKMSMMSFTLSRRKLLTLLLTTLDSSFLLLNLALAGLFWDLTLLRIQKIILTQSQKSRKFGRLLRK